MSHNPVWTLLNTIDEQQHKFDKSATAGHPHENPPRRTFDGTMWNWLTNRSNDLVGAVDSEPDFHIMSDMAQRWLYGCGISPEMVVPVFQKLAELTSKSCWVFRIPASMRATLESLALAAEHAKKENAAMENARPSEAANDLKEQMSPTSRVIALMVEFARKHVPYTVKGLAKMINCNRTSLYKDPDFRKARAAIQFKIPKGSKDADGNIEAIDE